jgi:hypothetical protein
VAKKNARSGGTHACVSSSLCVRGRVGWQISNWPRRVGSDQQPWPMWLPCLSSTLRIPQPISLVTSGSDSRMVASLRCPATLSSSRILTHRGESGPRQTQASYEGVGRMFQSPKRKTATLLHTDTCLRNLHTRYSFVRSCNSVIRLLHARSELNTRSE